ncbi:MAG: hypothetical protein R3B13_06555 [Polyangiaceae bacterium]
MSSEFQLPLAPAIVKFGIPLIALLLSALFVAAVRKAALLAGRTTSQANRATGLALAGVTAWLSITALLASRGVLLRFDVKPPPMALLMATIIGGGVTLGLSRVGALLQHHPLWLLVLVQSFRLPLEIVMHEAATRGVMPVQMSFAGYNYDIVTGGVALVLGVTLALRGVPRAFVWAWNIYGCAALVVIAIVAVAASPLLRAFGDDALNVWVLFFPYVWLPAIMVTFAIAGHVVVFRKLRQEAAQQEASAALPAIEHGEGQH